MTMRARTPKDLYSRVAALQAPARLPGADPVVATHLLSRRDELLTHDVMAALVDVTPRTLDSWVDRGCPVAKRRGPVRYYRAREVFVWSAAFRMVRDDHQARRIRHMPTALPFLDAHNRLTARQHALITETPGDGEPEAFVCVPLAHDHPSRPWALRIACEGRVPGPIPDPEEWIEAIENDFASDETPDPPAPSPRRRKETR